MERNYKIRVENIIIFDLIKKVIFKNCFWLEFGFVFLVVMVLFMKNLI